MPTDVPASEGGLLVFLWDGDVALGHVWLESDRLPISGSALTEMAPRRADGHSSSNTPLPPSGTASSISIVIPTRRRPEALRRCLSSLQDQFKAPLAVIVVDNTEGDPETRAVTESFPDVRYITEPVAGLSTARNTGVRHAGGALVGFVDDDETVHPAWTQAMEHVFAETQCDLVTGLVLPASIATRAQYLFERRYSFIRGYSSWIADANETAPWKLGGGGNMVVRREWFDRLGGFDERLGAGRSGCSEDTDFFQRLLDGGAVCRYDPRAVVFHFHRAEYDAFKRQARAYMRGHVTALAAAWLERGDSGARRRLMRSLPRHCAASIARAALKPRDLPPDLVIGELAGCFGGVMWILREGLLTRLLQRGISTTGSAVSRVLRTVRLMEWEARRGLKRRFGRKLSRVAQALTLQRAAGALEVRAGSVRAEASEINEIGVRGGAFGNQVGTLRAGGPGNGGVAALSGAAAADRKTATATDRKAAAAPSAEDLPILMYHRVAPEGSAGMAPWRVHPDQFESQLQLLRDSGRCSVSFEQVRRWKERGEPLPQGAMMITFDDGYADFVDYAGPLLAQYGFTATVFVVAAEIGGWNAWDRSYGERIPLLDWPAIRSLHAGGIEIGAHTNTHPMLTKVSTGRAWEEMQASKHTLEDGLGEAVPSVAYPWGESSPRIHLAAAAAGFHHGVTVVPRPARRADSLLSLPRIDVEGHFTIDEFARKLALGSTLRQSLAA